MASTHFRNLFRKSTFRRLFPVSTGVADDDKFYGIQSDFFLKLFYEVRTDSIAATDFLCFAPAGCMTIYELVDRIKRQK